MNWIMRAGLRKLRTERSSFSAELKYVCTEKSIQLGTGEDSHEEADSAHSLGRC